MRGRARAASIDGIVARAPRSGGRVDRHEFDLERLRDHDGLAGAGVGGDGRAGAVWSIGRAEEPPGPDDLAVDLAPAAQAGSPSAAGAIEPQAAFSPAKPRSGQAFSSCGATACIWFLTILAATAVAALIITRAMILSGASQRAHSLKLGRRRCVLAASSPSFSSVMRNHSDTRNLSMMPFAFLPNLGMPELIIVAFVSLLIFGNRLPSVMRSLGKSVTEFKKGDLGDRGRDRSGRDRRQETDPAHA